MISKLAKRILDVWQKLSEREKRLAVVTGAAIILVIAFTTYQRAMARVDDLDLTIARLEDDLVSQTLQIAHRELVESRYAKIATQHSSEWTEAEIHDRLRQEIYRLARKTPPALNENGIPVEMPNEEGNLVEIPSLGKGNMAEGGKGYREYRINLRIPPCPIESLVLFLERLQQSPQSLRIDALELNRSPDGELVSSSIDITRIVADGVPNAAGNPEPADPTETASELGRIALQAKDWQATGGTVQDSASAGSIEFHVSGDAAEVSLLRNLPGGSVYEMVIDIAAAQGEATLGVGMESAEEPFQGSEKITADGNSYRLHVQFTVPGKTDTQARIKCPVIKIQGKEAVVLISNLLLKKVAEV